MNINKNYKGSMKGKEQLHKKGLVTVEHMQVRDYRSGEYSQYLIIRCKGYKEIVTPYFTVEKGGELMGYSALYKEQFVLENSD